MNCVQKCWPVIVVILFLCFFNLRLEIDEEDDQQFCTVKTNSGFIRGIFNQTIFDGKLYYSFRGIPFAKQPINELRFKVAFFDLT